MPLEDELLSAAPYTDAPKPMTPEDQADNLVNALMHQLRCERDLTQVIDDWADDRKAQVHDKLVRVALMGITKPDLLRPIEAPQYVEAGSLPFTDRTLEPETEGEVFQVQVGGEIGKVGR